MGNVFSREQVFEAVPVSPGVAIGRVYIFLRSANRTVALDERQIRPEEVDGEILRFRTALSETRAELLELQEQLRSRLNSSEADIFDAHMMIVDDTSMHTEVTDYIRKNLRNADYAFHKTAERYAAVFAAMQDEYLRERSMDIRDVALRIRSHLNHDMSGRLGQMTDRRIIVANDLTPSETALLDKEKVLGFALESGSATCHSAILARSMQLPALTGIPHGLLETLTGDDKLIIDGFTGKLIVNPEQRTEDAYRVKAAEAGRFYSNLRKESMLMPETADGFMIQLAGNLESAEGLSELTGAGACGVGLLRTEFLYLNRETPPSEEEQLEIYKSLLVATEGRPVIVRTLDVGGDKGASHIYNASEDNPFLGLRGIRLCLHERRDIFRTQLRALLRAGTSGQLKVMLPMITNVREVLEVKSLVAELQRELKKEKLDYVSKLSIGVMIETPAAALQADKLAEVADFFSIGTNDLAQYTMAVDRGNDRVTYLYEPSHPVILRLIHHCVKAARHHNIWVSVCGQMAAEPQFTPLLVGIGVHELSMDANSLGAVRRVIRGMTMHEAEAVAKAAMECGSAAEALDMSLRLLRKVAPEVAMLIEAE